MVDSWNAAILNEAVQNGGGATGHDELSEMRDVTITTPASGEVLSYNGSKWVNEALTASDIGYGESSDVDTALDYLLDTEVTTEAAEGFSFAPSVAKAGALVGGSIQVTGSASANAWTDVGSIAVLPDHIIMLPLVNVSSGAYVGMARIKTNGDISVFPTTTITSSTVAFDFSYHEYIAP